MADTTPADPNFPRPVSFPPRDQERLAAPLPTLLTGFVGREREVAAVSELLRRPDVRLVTLTGHGAWEASGPNEASFTCIGFESDGYGNLFAVVSFRGSLALGADRHMLKGEMIATIDDPQGTTMAKFPMTLEGTRIAIE